MKTVTVLVPCLNEADGLGAFHTTLTEAISPLRHRYRFEIIYVDDGSTDNTATLVERWRADNPEVNLLRLSRNFGKELAMLAGMDFATGDCLITMDADLQHPPILIGAMLAKWEEGFADIYGRRVGQRRPLLQRVFSGIYRKLLRRLDSHAAPDAGQCGDFRLLDRRCVDALRSMRESQRYTKGLYSWIGFNKTGVDFVVNRRHSGRSKWGLRKLGRLAVDGITSRSLVPLRVASILGMFVSSGAFLFLIYVVIKALVYGDPVAGYPSLMAVMLFLGGSILLALGIIGEYVGRIFMETKHRPPYLVESFNSQPIDHKAPAS